MTVAPYSCILWDVDGTIADASRGILPRLIRVLASYGLPRPEPEELSRWIGPPLIESFHLRAGLDADQAEEAVHRYRELARLAGYASDVELYPGIAEVIRDVHAAGVPQSTASSKPEVQVIAILEHFELLDRFTAISGAQPGPGGRGEGKSEVIARAIERLAAAGADVSRPVLIGDRHHDLDGGAEHGIPVIFAEWGFGEPSEAEGAVASAASAAELRALILPRPLPR